MSGGGRPRVALSLSEERSLRLLARRGPQPALGECLRALGQRPLAPGLLAPGSRVEALHYGSEFCEHLIPGPRALGAALATAEAAGLALCLLTPMVSDRGLRRVRALLARLPAGSEVVANDWGVLGVLRDEFPALVPAAGRQLCKMVKDPRLPSAAWTRLTPHGVHSAPFLALLERLGVARLEVDVPPFARLDDLRGRGLPLAVHAPFGYATRARICKIGCLRLPAAERFAPGHRCRKECLRYVERLDRGAEHDLPTLRRGNTVLYRHGAEMTRTLAAALGHGDVARLVIAGDWNEDRRTA